MEEFIVFVSQSESGAYLAETPLLPGEMVTGSSPSDAFAKLKLRAEKCIASKGLKVAQITFRAAFGSKEIEAAKAAFENGKCQELEAAFAEIAGLSIDDWRRKVAARQQTVKP
jgi:predicted RNase H-like HicB family nuclease